MIKEESCVQFRDQGRLDLIWRIRRQTLCHLGKARLNGFAFLAWKFGGCVQGSFFAPSRLNEKPTTKLN